MTTESNPAFTKFQEKQTEEVCENQRIRLICGKCNTEQFMEVRRYGKKPKEYTLYCPKCDDLISQSACKFVPKKREA